MKTTFFLALLSTAVSFVAADIVITPVFADQIVQKQSGDCFFGVVTPQGCAYVFFSRLFSLTAFHCCLQTKSYGIYLYVSGG